jgi:integrase/recombinase XerD
MHLQSKPFPIENALFLNWGIEAKSDKLLKELENELIHQSEKEWILKNTFQNVHLIRKHYPSIATKDVKIPINEYQHRKIDVFERKIILKIPKNTQDLDFLSSLKFSRWNNHQKQWEIPNYPVNKEKIIAHFLGRIDTYRIHEINSVHLNSKETISKSTHEVILVYTVSKRIRILFGFHKELIDFIKKIPYNSWDSTNKWWSIPFSDVFCNQLKEKINSMKLEIREIHEIPNEKQKRKTAYNTVNYKSAPENFLLKIKELRYSESTYKTYKNALEDYLNFHANKDIEKLNEEDIQSFLRHLVMERKVSTSYQNQAINAIKFYYERVLGGQRKTYFIDRPKKEKALPVVLSEEEVISIFKNCNNLKHKAILMLIYSAGLRISEAINVKIKDIDSNRMQIRIEQSKGKKDRYTLLSHKTLSILREYYKEYKPKEYLFEGQFSNQYSARSIQAFFRQICSKAGITKEVTVHSLRHSFATHLLENGTNLRYIQSLLGHSSSKITEVYTHITTKGFENLKSPIDNLEF